MAEHAKENTLETTIANLTDEREDGTDNVQSDSAYTPVFSKQVRTVVRVGPDRFVRWPWLHDLR